MSIFSRFGRAVQAFVTKTDDTTIEAWFREFGGGLESATGLAISTAGALNVSTVYACVSMRAKDFARCTPRLLPQKEGRSVDPVSNHPVARIFKNPNTLQTWYEFAVMMHSAYLLRGNAYAAIIRNMRGDPVSLWPLNPDGVHLYEGQNGELFYSVMRAGLYQTWQLRGFETMIPEEDILHIRGLGLNALYGVSTINVARDAIGVALGLEQQAARFMRNGARPAGVLQTDKKLTKDTADRLRQQWTAMREGVHNAGRTAILEEGLKWEPMQLSSVDLEFIGQRKNQVEEIARYFGVPLHRLGVAGENSRIKLDDADQSYVNTTVMPDLDMWEQRFDKKFALGDGKPALEADFDERLLLRAAESTRMNNYRLGVLSGLMTPNEARRLEGLPPMKGGDELMFPVNTAALGSDATGTSADGAGRPEDGTLPDGGPGSKNPEDAK